MKKFKWILFIVITVFSLTSVIYAGVMQCILSYEKYGIILSGKTSLFIPDKSAWGFLGLIGLATWQVWFED